MALYDQHAGLLLAASEYITMHTYIHVPGSSLDLDHFLELALTQPTGM